MTAAAHFAEVDAGQFEDGTGEGNGRGIGGGQGEEWPMFAIDLVPVQAAFELGAPAEKAVKAHEAYRERVEELEALTVEQQREIFALQGGGKGRKEQFEGVVLERKGDRGGGAPELPIRKRPLPGPGKDSQGMVPAAAKGKEQPRWKETGGGDAPYKLVSGVEDALANEEMLRTMLDTEVTVKLRTLMSLAPSLRKGIKDLCTTRRMVVSANIVQVTEILEAIVANADKWAEGHVADEEAGRVVADAFCPLRVVKARVAGLKEYECILDTGASIVVMNEPVWREIAVGLDPTKTATMQSANSSQDSTLGCLTDVEFEIGGVVLHLQVQVVKQAPFDILLGQPFFQLGACEFKAFTTAGPTLTIHDPNSDKVVTVPAAIRSPADGKRKAEGF